MGTSRKNGGVLKLVHPGRFVETLTEPITAAEVMQKNPRHSVTRPDVFYFPWVVVKPESLLTPGEVFFIVPNRTIHQLMKGKMNHNWRPSSQQRVSPHDLDHHQFELASPSKEYAGMTPKHRKQESLPKRIFQTLYCRKSNRDEDLKMETPHRYSHWTESRTRRIPKYVGDQRESERVSPGDSTFGKTCFRAIDFYLGRRNMSTELLERDAAVELNCQKYGTVLKSCLRKSDSARKSLNFKVTFVLPKRDEEADASVS